MSSQKIQIGLWRFLLILVTCAAWLAYLGNEYQRSNANASLIRTLKATRSLDVVDTSRITANSTAFQSGSNWSMGMSSSHITAYKSLQCYLPHDGWEICIATRDFPVLGFPKASETAVIRKGTSEIELTVSTDGNESEINLRIEGVPVFRLREDKTWCNAEFLLPDGSSKQILQTVDAGSIELTRLKFANMKRKDKITDVEETPPVTNGVLIWLRKLGDQ